MRGAALSNGIAGYVVKIAGYNTAFLFLAAIAAAGCALFYFAMPETKRNGSPTPLPNQIPATA